MLSFFNMNAIKDSGTENNHFPRHKVESIEVRKRDLVFRISDWTSDRDEPAYDVETYIGGIHDFNESAQFSTKNANRTKKEAKQLAIEFVKKQVEKLL